MQRTIGRIGRAHGIRGEVNVDIRTDEPGQRFAPGSSVVVGSRALTIKAARQHGSKMVIAFDGVTDRNSAETLHGAIVTVDVDPAVLPGDPEEFYDHQLIGLQVRTVSGGEAGVVEQVLHLPAQDTLLIRCDAREIMVPFVAALVPEVDVAGGYVVVADIPGLLDPDAADGAGAP